MQGLPALHRLFEVLPEAVIICAERRCDAPVRVHQKRGIGVGTRHHESWECERPKPRERIALSRIANRNAARELEKLADAARPLELEYVILYDR